MNFTIVAKYFPPLSVTSTFFSYLSLALKVNTFKSHFMTYTMNASFPLLPLARRDHESIYSLRKLSKLWWLDPRNRSKCHDILTLVTSSIRTWSDTSRISANSPTRYLDVSSGFSSREIQPRRISTKLSFLFNWRRQTLVSTLVCMRACIFISIAFTISAFILSRSVSPHVCARVCVCVWVHTHKRAFSFKLRICQMAFQGKSKR